MWSAVPHGSWTGNTRLRGVVVAGLALIVAGALAGCIGNGPVLTVTTRYDESDRFLERSGVPTGAPARGGYLGIWVAYDDEHRESKPPHSERFDMGCRQEDEGVFDCSRWIEREVYVVPGPKEFGHDSGSSFRPYGVWYPLGDEGMIRLLVQPEWSLGVQMGGSVKTWFPNAIPEGPGYEDYSFHWTVHGTEVIEGAVEYDYRFEVSGDGAVRLLWGGFPLPVGV